MNEDRAIQFMAQSHWGAVLANMYVKVYNGRKVSYLGMMAHSIKGVY